MGPLALSLLAGFLLTQLWSTSRADDCRLHLEDGQTLRLSGWLERGLLEEGRGELRPEPSGATGCREVLRLVVPGGREADAAEGILREGTRLSLRGTWRGGSPLGLRDPARAGYLRVDSLLVLEGPAPLDFRRSLARLGAVVQARLDLLFSRTAPVAKALVWARKDGVSPALREAFARAGTAHLLAISGFHVGVVAGLLVMALGGLGLSPGWRFLLASGGVWLYVVAIGSPDAALRAALLLTLLVTGRLSGRSLASLGALATAFMLFLAFDPGALLRPGFQLSFAGASGLTLGHRPLVQEIFRRVRGRIPRGVCGAVAAGVAATLATLPVVAWHFGRVSLVGIPVTLLSAPLVALAIPGIFGALLASSIHPALGRIPASGVETLLDAFLALTRGAASLPFASVPVSRPMVVAWVGVSMLALVLLRSGLRSRGWRIPLLLLATPLVGSSLGEPVARLVGRGGMELVILDVGQGDAALIRSPAGRWMLVDAGPLTTGFDAGENVVVPFLRRRGVRELALMILTHPDMDHVGGAASVLRAIPTRTVLDPGLPAGTRAFIGALEAALESRVPWRHLASGDSLDFDGVALRVLAPGREMGEGVPGDANEASVVLELRFGEFGVLLTGDAPTAVEARLLPEILSPRIPVLKVGHHGSATSTSRELVERIRPEIGVISVGRRNRFGHPDPEILERLEGIGATLFRTDRDGDLRIRARENGTFRISTEFSRR